MLAVNINSPAKERGRRQLKELLRSKSDILILTEVKKSAAAEEIISGLRADGYHVIGWSEEHFDDFTTIIASKVAYQTSVCIPSRTQQLTLASTPNITVIAAYGVSSDPFGRNSEEKIRAKQEWIKTFVDHARSKAREAENLLIIGDLNFVDDRARRQYDSLYGFERTAYTDLISIPMLDILYESEEYSWISHQGSGFRFDHALASPSLAVRVDTREYIHEWRMGEERLTDHSAIRVRVSATFEPVGSPDSSGSYQTTLF